MSLAVPPAYDDVWICPISNGHLQATGRDVRGRKQYRYHPDWTRSQSETKFAGLADFGERLPRIRRHVREDLKHNAGDRVFALAAAVRLIDSANLRVGNIAYTRENNSYGALTLRDSHVTLTNGRIGLKYRAKGGKLVKKRIADRTLLRALEKIGELPGATLLSWSDADGATQILSSEALNSYINEAAGDDNATAKTFRTWAGTLAAFEVAEQGHATIKDMSKAAAKALHNTATIARTSYIHPAVIDLADTNAPDVSATAVADLKQSEQRLLEFLRLST